MKQKRIGCMLSACLIMASAFQSGELRAMAAVNSEETVSASFDSPDVVSDFDLSSFIDGITENEEKLCESLSFDEAREFIDSQCVILDELSSSYSILQFRYLSDNTDMDSFYKMNETATSLYEAQSELSSFIRRLSELNTYSELKDDYKLLPAFDPDFIKKQSALVNEYYLNGSDTHKSAQIFIDLVKCRYEQAMKIAGTDYPDLIFRQVYNRDYSIMDFQNIEEKLASFISSYSDKDLGLNEEYAKDSGLSAYETISKFEENIAVLPDTVTSVYEKAKSTDSFLLSDNENGSPAVITSYLYKYHEPYTYVKYSETEADINNLINQLGSYTALYYKENGSSYFSKIHMANDVKLTIRNYIKLLYSKNDSKNAVSEILTELQYSYLINSFEAYAYSQPELTEEKLSQKFYEIKKSLGYKYNDDQTSDDSWVYLENLYTTPFLMADSVVSSLTALEYFDIMQTGQAGKAEKILDSFLTSKTDARLSELSEISSLPDCLDSKNTEVLFQKWESYLSDIYGIQNDRLPGDANNDGSVTAMDLVIIKKYILCLINKEDMNKKGYSFENADLNQDGRINAFDLMRLCRLLLE